MERLQPQPEVSKKDMAEFEKLVRRLAGMRTPFKLSPKVREIAGKTEERGPVIARLENSGLDRKYDKLRFTLRDRDANGGHFFYKKLISRYSTDSGERELIYREGIVSQEELDAPQPQTSFEYHWKGVKEYEALKQAQLDWDLAEKFPPMMKILRKIYRHHSLKARILGS